MPLICIIPTLCLYSAAALLALVARQRPLAACSRYAGRCFGLGFLLHTIYLPVAIWREGAASIGGHRGGLLLLVWVLAALTVGLTRRERWRGLAPILYSAVALFALPVLLGGQGSAASWITEAWPLIPVHVTGAIVALGVFLVSGLVGIGYVWQERALKARRPTPQLLRFPSLPSVERAITRLMLLGFVALTLTVGTGVILGGQAPSWLGSRSHGLLSLLGWVLYGFLLQSRVRRWQPGRRWVFFALLGLAVLLLSFVEVHGVK